MPTEFLNKSRSGWNDNADTFMWSWSSTEKYYFSLSFVFPYHHQILMAYPVEWIMDPPEHEWEHDMTTNTIMATTTMVVRTYIHLGRVHEGAAPDVLLIAPPAPGDFPGAFLGKPLGPWDFPLEPLPNFLIEPMSPGLP